MYTRIVFISFKKTHNLGFPVLVPPNIISIDNWFGIKKLYLPTGIGNSGPFDEKSKPILANDKTIHQGAQHLKIFSSIEYQLYGITRFPKGNLPETITKIKDPK